MPKFFFNLFREIRNTKISRINAKISRKKTLFIKHLKKEKLFVAARTLFSKIVFPKILYSFRNFLLIHFLGKMRNLAEKFAKYERNFRIFWGKVFVRWKPYAQVKSTCFGNCCVFIFIALFSVFVFIFLNYLWDGTLKLFLFYSICELPSLYF